MLRKSFVNLARKGYEFDTSKTGVGNGQKVKGFTHLQLSDADMMKISNFRMWDMF